MPTTGPPPSQDADPPDADDTRPLRSDAVRNHRLLLEAASLAFAEHGLEVPMEEIATAAGVGVATLYRHFASREALIAALMEQSLAGIAVRAEEIIDSGVDPMVGLRSLLTYGAERHTVERSMAEMWRTLNNDIAVAAARGTGLYEATQRMLDAAVDAGEIRDDVTVEDVARIFYAIAGVVEAGHGHAWRRVLELHLRGMTAEGPSLPKPI